MLDNRIDPFIYGEIVKGTDDQAVLQKIHVFDQHSLIKII